VAARTPGPLVTYLSLPIVHALQLIAESTHGSVMVNDRTLMTSLVSRPTPLLRLLSKVLHQEIPLHVYHSLPAAL
jgi:hypothetical protein